MNQDRLQWAVRTRQRWPLIRSIEGCTYTEYRQIKEQIRRRGWSADSDVTRSSGRAEQARTQWFESGAGGRA